MIQRPLMAGGGERVAAVIAERLDSTKFERILCSTREMPGQTFEAQLQAAGVRLLNLRRRSALFIWQWWPLYRLLRRERVDILHAHMFGSNLWGVLLGRLARVPVIIAHEHTWSFEGSPLRRFLDREVIARGADVVVAVSGEDRRKMIEIEGIDPSVIRLVPNGITPPPPSGTDVRTELGIDPAAPVIGIVAAFRPQKAIDVLLRAVGQLIERFPSLKVLIAGDGPGRSGLCALARELGLSDVVVFLGRRSDVPDVLAAMDIAVSSSAYEGSPLSIIEYMAAGKPVIATRVGGVPELIEDGVQGLLVTPGDPSSLAEAISRLLLHPWDAARMGTSGRHRQREQFSLDGFMGRIEALYEELFAATDRARAEGWVPRTIDLLAGSDGGGCVVADGG